MKIKTSELTGAALDFAVAKCEGKTFQHGGHEFDIKNWTIYSAGLSPIKFSPSTNWAQGGPIIEREKISAEWHEGRLMWRSVPGIAGVVHFGPTPLIAAMRCYVASKLGDNVEIPDELCK